MRAWALILLLLLAGAAGCIGGDDGAVEPGSTSKELAGGTGQGPTVGQTLAATFGQAEALSEQRWENGSFQVTEHSYPKGMVTGLTGEYDPDRRELDLTPMIPAGVPVHLTAEVNADLGEGDVDIWFSLPQERIYTATFDTPYGGYSRIEMTVVRTESDPVTLNLRYDEIDDSAGFDYTLQVGAHLDPGIVPPGVPVSLEVPEQATGIAVDFQGDGDERAVMLWDPADGFIGRLEASGDRLVRVLEPEDPRGAYVLMLPGMAGPAQLSLLNVTGPAPQLTALPQVLERGELASAGPGEGSVSWSFQTDRVPLQAALFWESSEVSQDTAATLTSPAGPLIDVAFNEDPWLGGAGFGWFTMKGAPGLVAGSYEAQASFGQDLGPSGMEAYHMLVLYDRGS